MNTLPPQDGLWAKRRWRDRYDGALSTRKAGVLAAVLEIATEVESTPAQVALAWVLSHPEITVADVGCDSVDQIDENLDALNLELSPAQIARLNGE